MCERTGPKIGSNIGPLKLPHRGLHKTRAQPRRAYRALLGSLGVLYWKGTNAKGSAIVLRPLAAASFGPYERSYTSVPPSVLPSVFASMFASMFASVLPSVYPATPPRVTPIRPPAFSPARLNCEPKSRRSPKFCWEEVHTVTDKIYVCFPLPDRLLRKMPTSIGTLKSALVLPWRAWVPWFSRGARHSFGPRSSRSQSLRQHPKDRC